MTFPVVIQGGMGAGVSSYLLAKSVSECGQLGVVSGTALDTILVRRLQQGDIDGRLKNALDHFPNREISQCIYQRYHLSHGRVHDHFQLIPKWTLNPTKELLELAVVANFVEVYLAKENHHGIVGINYLEKIQMPHLASIYGAMLAGVDYILMGAGIPMGIADILDKYVQHEPASLKIRFIDGNSKMMDFNPHEIIGVIKQNLKRPKFLAIISSAILAKRLKHQVDGFIIEGYDAGGHNAAPRGPKEFNERGELLYSTKDDINIADIRKIDLPFWLAGGLGHPSWLEDIKNTGAFGIQVGTPFALCHESGLAPQYKKQILAKILDNNLDVFTDPKASPTGFPFKVVVLDGTLSEQDIYEQRTRICDLGYLRLPIVANNGTIQYLCPAENVTVFERKGGQKSETQGRKCLCNALLANINLGQERKKNGPELPLVTLGSTYYMLKTIVENYGLDYHAHDVINFLLP